MDSMSSVTARRNLYPRDELGDTAKSCLLDEFGDCTAKSTSYSMSSVTEWLNPCHLDEIADRTAATRQNTEPPPHAPTSFGPHPNYIAHRAPPTNLVYHPMPPVRPLNPHLKVAAFSLLSKSVYRPLLTSRPYLPLPIANCFKLEIQTRPYIAMGR